MKKIVLIVVAIVLVSVSLFGWIQIIESPNRLDKRIDEIETQITATTVTPTPYSGIKCMVNGYEIKTDLASAKAAGCK